MRLDIARELKQELLAGITERLRVRGDAPETSLALGIAPAKRREDYRIAVRPRSARDLAGLREYIDDRTRGEMEIRVTGPIRAAESSTLCMGASVSRDLEPRRTGSLGFFARRNSDGAIGFVSNNHILAGEDVGNDGDVILHPGRADCRQFTPAHVALLDGDYPRLKESRGITIDCAFARLVDADHAQLQRSLGPSVPALSDLPVWKIGRSTGKTHGRVSAFALDRCSVQYRRLGRIDLQGQIEVESLDAFQFARGGDSGSLILTEDCEPLALIHSVSAAGGRNNNSGLTFAHPIQSVLDALDVSFLS